MRYGVVVSKCWSEVQSEARFGELVYVTLTSLKRILLWTITFC